jgi:aminoglycoside phosphotransferase (APT) family kinase protein
MSSNGEDDPNAFDAALGRVLTARIPDVLALRSAERLSGGASQETYRLVVETPNGQRHLALRRAVGGGVVDEESTAPGLAVEAQLMQVARAAGVPEPEVFHVLLPEDGLGQGFVMEWLDGETLGARIVRSPELAEVRPRLAYQCGEILARIHSIDLDEAGLRDRLQTMTSEQFVHQMWERYREFGTPQPMIDFAARWLLDHLPGDVEPRLVHNDFRNGNLMIGPGGVIAVLDWEVAHIGDPMRDLGWLCTNSWRFGADLPVGGFGQREDLFAGYEAVSGEPVDPERVRFWEVFGSYWWAIGCLTMAERYRTGPDRTVERPGIGRRSSECQVDCVNLLIPGPVVLVGGSPPLGVTDMPSMEELLGSVTDFLRDDVMAATSGRTNFLARVASNSLDIVRRELAIGPELRERETLQLQAMFASSDDLTALKWRLVDALRDGTMALDRPGLAEYLREAVVNQIAIDQPRYSGFQVAADRAVDA